MDFEYHLPGRFLKVGCTHSNWHLNMVSMPTIEGVLSEFETPHMSDTVPFSFFPTVVSLTSTLLQNSVDAGATVLGITIQHVPETNHVYLLLRDNGQHITSSPDHLVESSLVCAAWVQLGVSTYEYYFPGEHPPIQEVSSDWTTGMELVMQLNLPGIHTQAAFDEMVQLSVCSNSTSLGVNMRLIVGFCTTVGLVPLIPYNLLQSSGIVFSTAHLTLHSSYFRLPYTGCPIVDHRGLHLGFCELPSCPLFASLFLVVHGDVGVDQTTWQLQPMCWIEFQTIRLELVKRTMAPAPISPPSPEGLLPHTSPQSPHRLILSALTEFCNDVKNANGMTVDMFHQCCGRLLKNSDKTWTPVARTIVACRLTDLYERSISPETLLARLASPVDSLMETQAACFDVLLSDMSPDDVPNEWHPQRLDPNNDAPFRSAMMLLLWRHTLLALINLAKTASGFEHDDKFWERLLRFRSGVLITSRASPYVNTRSVCRRSINNCYLFFFNPSPTTLMVQQPTMEAVGSTEYGVNCTLRAQNAFERRVCVSFFVTQAISLLAPLLHPEDVGEAYTTLSGVYRSNRAAQMETVYKDLQTSVRRLRSRAREMGHADRDRKDEVVDMRPFQKIEVPTHHSSPIRCPFVTSRQQCKPRKRAFSDMVEFKDNNEDQKRSMSECALLSVREEDKDETKPLPLIEDLQSKVKEEVGGGGDGSDLLGEFLFETTTEEGEQVSSGDNDFSWLPGLSPPHPSDFL